MWMMMMMMSSARTRTIKTLYGIEHDTVFNTLFNVRFLPRFFPFFSSAAEHTVRSPCLITFSLAEERIFFCFAN